MLLLPLLLPASVAAAVVTPFAVAAAAVDVVVTNFVAIAADMIDVLLWFLLQLPLQLLLPRLISSLQNENQPNLHDLAEIAFWYDNNLKHTSLF